MTEFRRIARVTPNTLYRDLQGEAVLLQLDTGEYFGLDEVACRVWQLIQEDGDLSRVHARLLLEYEIDAARLQADLEGLIEELSKRRLVHVERRPASEA